MFHSRLDRPLVTAVLLLSFGGLVLLYSASGGDWHLIAHQAIWLGIGLFVMGALGLTPPRYYRLIAPAFFIVVLLLLVLVLVIGSHHNGARRWIDLGPILFQPSELMKIALPLALAWFFHDHSPPPRWYFVFAALAIILVPSALILLQPDLGTAILIAGAGAMVLLLSGMHWRYVFAFLIVIGAALPLGWHFLHDYQRERLLTFLDPSRDPLGAGYHIIQSKIAIGSGGLFGQGFLGGSQAQLNFLPEQTTDFAFAVFSEQFGYVGVLALLALYAFIIGRGFVLAFRAHTRFGRLAAAGLIFTFLLYVVVNVGMVSGVVPVVGVPLPLVSYGGSSIVTVLAAFGILISIASHRRLIDT
ncbi:MAG: rod shape-determining protein RodA [Gammaproteobacteria bacterium]